MLLKRAIKRGTGQLNDIKIEEVLYEAIGPQNIGIIIELVTDNKNRTSSEIKTILTKFGGKLVGSGAVSHQFEKKGRIVIDLSDKEQEEVELLAIDAGAQDFDEKEDKLVIFTKLNELQKIKEILEDKGLDIREAVLSWEPKTIIEITDKEESEKIIILNNELEDLDDVINIYSNFNLKGGQNANIGN